MDDEQQALEVAADVPAEEAARASADERVTGVVAGRCVVGGVFMGLANLVPGISGGTMLLAAGVYPRFIKAVADVSTLKLRKPSVVVLGIIVAAALGSIVGLAGPVKELVVQHRWAMYSLFIGLTLGGVPVVWGLIRADGKRATGAVWGGAVAGFVGMAALAYVQMQGGGGADRTGWGFMLLAGVAGASAMILPGVSGGYLLLVLGVYVPILAAISGFKDAVFAMDVSAAMGPGLSVVLPVGLGVLVGVAGVSNLLKWLLARCERATLGVLLGLLVGAVVGLWPFQEAVMPGDGETVKARVVSVADGEVTFVATGDVVEVEDWPTAFFTPSGGRVAASAGLVLVGLAVTLGVTWIGRDRKRAVAAEASADGA